MAFGLARNCCCCNRGTRCREPGRSYRAAAGLLHHGIDNWVGWCGRGRRRRVNSDGGARAAGSGCGVGMVDCAWSAAVVASTQPRAAVPSVLMPVRKTERLNRITVYSFMKNGTTLKVGKCERIVSFYIGGMTGKIRPRGRLGRLQINGRPDNRHKAQNPHDRQSLRSFSIPPSPQQPRPTAPNVTAVGGRASWQIRTNPQTR